MLAIAVARAGRGCHYCASPKVRVEDPGYDVLPNEIMATALLGGEVTDRFYHLRVGGMVLSCLTNRAEVIANAARYFRVGRRVLHIAHLALGITDHPKFWHSIVGLVASKGPPEENLSGLSRFVSETPISGPGRGRSRVWLGL